MTDPRAGMRSVAVREIEPADYADVARVLVAAYDATGPFTPDYRSFLGRPRDWVPGTTTTFVAQDGDPLVGVVAFTLPGDPEFETPLLPVADCGFRFLAVDPAAQGAGAGRALVQACLRAARQHGRRRMVIHSMWFMTAAHRRYAREGFVRRPDLDIRFPTGVGYGFQRDLVRDADRYFPPPDPVPDEPPWYEDVWEA